MNTDTTKTSSKTSSYIKNLEERLTSRSDALEESHLEAAIDAQLTLVEPNVEGDANAVEEPIFSDYTNPNAVRNCLSPYVPTSFERIDAFTSLTKLSTEDILLDIGCGDGRVCIASTKTVGCKVVGIDVSPLCITMAKDVAKEEGLQESLYSFFEADATVDPDTLLSESSPFLRIIKDVTVIYLYTYPTLLMQLIPLLEHLTASPEYAVRAIATLTYHLPEDQVDLVCTSEDHDIRMYSHVMTKAITNK